MFNKAHFDQLLQRMLEKGASDLHLSSNEHPFFREDGRLIRQDDLYSTAVELEQVALNVLNVNQQAVFTQHQQVDVAIAYGNERYRVNVYRDRGNVSFAIRLLDNEFRSLEELNLPPQLDKFTQMKDGLVLVTGPTGSGKSTTLASIIDKINRTRADHIITVEDPIEYVHTNKKSLIHQRELYTDVQTFDGAVRAALREDPDVMLIGEMRDVETIRAAITAAETGHLVFSTLHTGDCVGAIDRMIGVFSAEEQLAIRQQLSMVLRAVVAQHLLPVADGDGRVPLAEVMFVTSAVANLIRTSKPSQIYSLMEIGSSEGMLTADFALAELVYRNQIREEDARRLARDPAAMVSRLQRLRGGVTPGSGYGIQL